MIEERLVRLRLQVIRVTAEEAMSIADADQRRAFIRQAYLLLWLDGREPATPEEDAALQAWLDEFAVRS